MRSGTDSEKASDYEHIASAIRYLDKRFKEQPSLKDVASAVGLSEFHFQRLFRRWAGISPKRFVQYLTAEHARRVLACSRDVFKATYDSGLSGLGRLHDLCVNIYAATPAQVRDAGASLEIRFGFVTSPFGLCFIAVTDRGLAGLEFVDEGKKQDAMTKFRGRWKSARFVEAVDEVSRVASRVFSTGPRSDEMPFTVFVNGTNFQIRVWEALARVPPGCFVTYTDVATSIGNPAAVRAVGSAIAANPIGYLIPCHRIILKSGAFGEYRWGAVRKRALLGWEAGQIGANAEEHE